MRLLGVAGHGRKADPVQFWYHAGKQRDAVRVSWLSRGIIASAGYGEM